MAALRCVDVLGRLAFLFAERKQQLASSVGLTVAQWQALEEVQKDDFMPSLFARDRESSPAAVSKVLRQLTDKGLITAEVNSTDARQRNYHLTRKGTTLLSRLRSERQAAIESVWLPLGPGALNHFAELGETVARRLEEYAERAKHEENEPSMRSHRK